MAHRVLHLGRPEEDLPIAYQRQAAITEVGDPQLVLAQKGEQRGRTALEAFSPGLLKAPLIALLHDCDRIELRCVLTRHIESARASPVCDESRGGGRRACDLSRNVTHQKR